MYDEWFIYILSNIPSTFIIWEKNTQVKITKWGWGGGVELGVLVWKHIIWFL